MVSSTSPWLHYLVSSSSPWLHPSPAEVRAAESAPTPKPWGKIMLGGLLTIAAAVGGVFAVKQLQSGGDGGYSPARRLAKSAEQKFAEVFADEDAGWDDYGDDDD